MARPGVTYSEVAEAAAHLVGQGKNPTIEQIRLLLGTGSSTTIANHLKQWKDSQKGTSLIAAKENIPQELIELLKGLWERVITQAEEKIASVENRFNQTVAQLQQEVEKYKNNNQRWQHLFNQWTQEKEQLSTDKHTLENTIQSAQKEKINLEKKQDVLLHQLAEKQARIDELHRLHTQTQKNLEHDRQAAREQRILEQQQFEQQKLELQTEIKTFKQQTVTLQEQISSLQQQHQSLQQTYKTVAQHYTQAESQIEKLTRQYEAAEKSKNEYSQAKIHWQNQYKETQIALEAKISQVIESETKAKTLIQQLENVKQSLHDAIEQKKLLDHEKWTLAQGKAQLEGQLKQLMAMNLAEA